jgi:hypothetical protein
LSTKAKQSNWTAKSGPLAPVNLNRYTTQKAGQVTPGSVATKNCLKIGVHFSLGRYTVVRASSECPGDTQTCNPSVNTVIREAERFVRLFA